MTRAKPSGLYWDERGSISCAKHAPYRGSDTWRLDRWRPMPASEVAAFLSDVGETIACETCRANAKREAPT